MMATNHELLQDENGLRLALREKVADLLGCDASEVEDSREFTTYGISSIEGLSLLADLEDMVNLELPDSLLWDYPTLAKLVPELLRQGAASVKEAA